MQLVYIEWEDASAADDSTWVDIADAPPAEKILFRQAGFLVDADHEALVLTEAIGRYQMAPRTRIPLGMVRSLVYLDPAAGEHECL